MKHMIKVFIVKNKLKRDVNMFERMETFEISLKV